MVTESLLAEEHIKIITDALAGKNQDQREIAFLGLSTVALMIRKNEDYGSSVFQPGAVSPDIAPEAGLRVRIGDKLSRINNLVKAPGSQRVSESITDTGHDASAYLLLWVISRMRAGGVEVCGPDPILLDGGPALSEKEGSGGPALSVEEQEDLEYIQGERQRVN